MALAEDTTEKAAAQPKGAQGIGFGFAGVQLHPDGDAKRHLELLVMEDTMDGQFKPLLKLGMEHEKQRFERVGNGVGHHLRWQRVSARKLTQRRRHMAPHFVRHLQVQLRLGRQDDGLEHALAQVKLGVALALVAEAHTEHAVAAFAHEAAAYLRRNLQYDAVARIRAYQTQ